MIVALQIQRIPKTKWATFIDIDRIPFCIDCSKGYRVENESISESLFASQGEIEQKVAMPISWRHLAVKRLFLQPIELSTNGDNGAVAWKVP